MNLLLEGCICPNVLEINFFLHNLTCWRCFKKLVSHMLLIVFLLQKIEWVSQKNELKITQKMESITFFFRILKLVSAIFKIFIFHQMIALQKLWKTFFISSKKLFLFSRYSNFCIFTFPFFSLSAIAWELVTRSTVQIRT